MADKEVLRELPSEPRERETVVIQDEKPRSGGTGWIILAGVLIVALGLIFLAKSIIDDRGRVEIENQAPESTNIQLLEPNPNPPTPPGASQ